MLNESRAYTDVQRKHYQASNRDALSSANSGLVRIHEAGKSGVGGFGTNAHLSSEQQNNPPSSLWRAHPIAEFLPK